MDFETAKKALAWTQEFLYFPKPLTTDQAQCWVSVMKDFDSKQWRDAVRLYYQTREHSFNPMVGEIVRLIPGKEKPKEKNPETKLFPKGWKEDPNLSYMENYIEMIKAREREDRIDSTPKIDRPEKART